MKNYQKLVALRNQYPSTTAATHALVIVAADLSEHNVVPKWFSVDGVDRAPLVFDACLSETVDCAIRESGESKPAKVRAFLSTFLSDFFDACPREVELQRQVKDRLFGKISH